MQEFFEPGVQGPEGMNLRPAAVYAELQIGAPDGSAFFVYLSTDDPRWSLWTQGTPTPVSFTAQACIENLLRPYFDLTEHPKDGDAWFELMTRTFPSFAQLWKDSEANRLERGGIRVVMDPDVSEPKFTIVVAADDVAFDAELQEKPWDIPRVRTAMVTALERSVALAVELQDKHIQFLSAAIERGLGAKPGNPSLRRIEGLTTTITKAGSWIGFLGKLGGG
jgi:hypothetical protein